MKLILLLLMVTLLPSCGFFASHKDSAASANSSALYDPPTVHLIQNKVYEFQEGTLAGRGQKFHSDYSYRQTIILNTP